MPDPAGRGVRDGCGHIARPIQIPWTCSRTGDCCRHISHVTVSADERTLLDQHAAGAVRPLEWTPHPDDQALIDQGRRAGRISLHTPRFYQLTARPCPFLSSQGLCTVYDVRPYNCRRFMCGRPDVQSESFEEGGPMGCHNLSDRVNTSLRFQEYFSAQMRRAQKDWALSHGWKA